MSERLNNEHEFAGMEEFLTVFCKKIYHSKRLFPIEPEEYFEKYPLTRDSYGKILAFLKDRKDYDVICAKFGIGTKKLTVSEYAAKKSITEKKAERLFKLAASCIRQDLLVKLYYMAIRPEHLRNRIFKAQFELHNMMLAYDELTGKDIAHEHHVGVCDGPTFGKKLFASGFDTLEEIQRADRTVIGQSDFLTCCAYNLSMTLKEYGLDNTLWRGALHCVSDNEFTVKKAGIWAIEDYGEVKIFFRSKKITVDEKMLKDVLNGLVFNGDCTGFDVGRVSNGDIWIYFNPTHHDSYHRRRAISKVVEVLSKGNVFVEEYEED